MKKTFINTIMYMCRILVKNLILMRMSLKCQKSILILKSFLKRFLMRRLILNKSLQWNKALINIVNLMENFNFDEEEKQQSLIDDKEYESRYKWWMYFKYLEETPQEPGLAEAIFDLLQIFPFSEKKIK